MTKTEKEKIQEQILKFIDHMIILNKFPVWYSQGEALQSLEKYSVHILEHATKRKLERKKKGKILPDESFLNIIDNTNEPDGGCLDAMTWCPVKCDGDRDPDDSDRLLEIHAGKNLMYIPLEMIKVYEEYLRSQGKLDNSYLKELRGTLEGKSRSKIIYP